MSEEKQFFKINKEELKGIKYEILVKPNESYPTCSECGLSLPHEKL